MESNDAEMKSLFSGVFRGALVVIMTECWFLLTRRDSRVSLERLNPSGWRRFCCLHQKQDLGCQPWTHLSFQSRSCF